MVEAALRMHAPWASRSLLPEAAQTRAKKLRWITFFFVFLRSSVRPQWWPSSVSSGKGAARLRAPPHNLSLPRVHHHSPTTTTTPWVSTCITLVFFEKVFHYGRGVHYPCVSPAGSNSAWAPGGHVIRGLRRTRRRATQQGRRAVEECRPACVSPPPVAARAQLNFSDDMTRARKNAHSSRGGFEWHGHAAGMVSGLCNSCAMRQLLRMNICCNRLLQRKNRASSQSVYLFGGLVDTWIVHLSYLFRLEFRLYFFKNETLWVKSFG